VILLVSVYVREDWYKFPKQMKWQQIKFFPKRLVSVVSVSVVSVSVPLSRAPQIYRQIKKQLKYGVFRNLKELGLFCFQNETNTVLLKFGNYLYSDTEVHVRRHKPTGVPLWASQVPEIEGRFKSNLHIFIVLHDFPVFLQLSISHQIVF